MNRYSQQTKDRAKVFWDMGHSAHEIERIMEPDGPKAKTIRRWFVPEVQRHELEYKRNKTERQKVRWTLDGAGKKGAPIRKHPCECATPLVPRSLTEPTCVLCGREPRGREDEREVRDSRGEGSLESAA